MEGKWSPFIQLYGLLVSLVEIMLTRHTVGKELIGGKENWPHDLFKLVLGFLFSWLFGFHFKLYIFMFTQILKQGHALSVEM